MFEFDIKIRDIMKMAGKIRQVLCKIPSERGLELIGVVKRTEDQFYIDACGKIFSKLIIKYVTTLRYNCLLLSLDFYKEDSEEDIKEYLIAAIKLGSKEIGNLG